MPLPRLRQLVLVAEQAEPVSAQLATLLGSPAYRDPGVGQFGLVNAVHAVGDGFVEVVAPVAAGTAAGRHLARHGPSGYMAMAEVADLATARERLDRLGVRVVWEVALPDVVDLHLHPKDVPGAIVALDVVEPPGSWPWGGPGWRPAAGGLTGLTVAVPEPQAACRRWADVLGAAADGDEIALDGGRQRVRFVGADGAHGIVAASVALVRPRGGPSTAMVAGVTLTLEDA